MFAEEAYTMHQMKHERIVEFIDFDASSFCIIMEYLPFGSLLAYIYDNPGFKWHDRYQVMLDICEGMAYLHSHKKLDGSPKAEAYHQDLKSANVLLTMDQNKFLRSKIADFGLSCEL
jgi:serine/threonine protein kinase